MARQDPVLISARIHPNQIPYNVWATNLGIALGIITIPLLIFTIPFTIWLAKRQYSRLSVTLHAKTLNIRRGILFVDEKTIPLNKITDLAIYHGPLMRAFRVKGMRIETAGQTGHTSFKGALAGVIGILNVEDFRDAVLSQRDHITTDSDGLTTASERNGPESHSIHQGDPNESTMIGTLTEIRDSLHRIERSLSETDSKNGAIETPAASRPRSKQTQKT